MALRLMPRSPRRRIRLSSVAPGLMALRSGWIKFATGSLAPATGVGTTRFCRTRQRRTSCTPDFAHNRIPSRVRDDRDTPLLPERDGRVDRTDLPDALSGIFLKAR